MKGYVAMAAAWAAVLTCPSSAADTLDACIAAADQAQPLIGAGHLLEARRTLLTCASDACPGAIRASCARWLTEVEARTPSIVVRVRDARGADLTDVRVSIDGELLQSHLDGLAHTVDPGTRELSFERSGAVSLRQTVVISEADRPRTIEVVLAAALPSVRPPATPSTARVLPWLLGGSGIALLAGAAAAWTIGLSNRGQLATSCASSHSCSADAVDQARTQLVVGDVLGIAGGVLAGAGLYIGVRTYVGAEAHAGGGLASLRYVF